MSLKSTVKCTGICSECGKCHGANLLKDAHGRKTKLVHFPDDFVPRTGEQGVGVAFDIGTTTVVAMAWNLMTGKEFGAVACTNPQNKFGADVISRITYCDDDPDKLREIRRTIIDGLNGLIAELIDNHPIQSDRIVQVVVGGNTTMSHIFAGYNPASLARAPFNPMKAVLSEVLTQDYYNKNIPLAVKFNQGIQSVIDKHNLPWNTTQLGCRTEYWFRKEPAMNGGEAEAAVDFELDQYMHLASLNRGILMTPFHNMALISAETSEADIDHHTAVFDEIVSNIL